MMSAHEKYLEKVHWDRAADGEEEVGFRPDLSFSLARLDALQQEIVTLRSALKEAIFMLRITQERRDVLDATGTTIEIGWTDQMKRLAARAGVDLNHYDPVDYHTWHSR